MFGDPSKLKQCMEKFPFSLIGSHCHNWNIFWVISIPDWHPLFRNNKIWEVFWNRMRIRISAGLLTKEGGHAKPSPHSWLASAQCVVRCAVPSAWGTFLSWRGAIKPLFNTISREDLVTVFSSSGSMIPFFFSVSPSLSLTIQLHTHMWVHHLRFHLLFYSVSSNTFTNASHLEAKTDIHTISYLNI